MKRVIRARDVPQLLLSVTPSVWHLSLFQQLLKRAYCLPAAPGWCPLSLMVTVGPPWIAGISAMSIDMRAHFLESLVLQPQPAHPPRRSSPPSLTLSPSSPTSLSNLINSSSPSSPPSSLLTNLFGSTLSTSR